MPAEVDKVEERSQSGASSNEKAEEQISERPVDERANRLEDLLQEHGVSELRETCPFRKDSNYL